MKIKILESAKEDLKEGFYFYEFQKKGLGEYFLESLYSDIDSLKLHAGIHAVFLGKYRRLLSKKIPFSIYYLSDHEQAIVHAVLDCRRDPAWAKKKLA